MAQRNFKHALPSISCSDAQHDALGNPGNLNKKTTSNLEKYKKQTLDSRFVSKYEGRRNGGIPCFSEERSIERAAKRMAEMKKRTDDEKQRDMAFFVALREGTPNIAQTLVGLNVRTSYTHAAESFRDMTPNCLPATMPAVRDIRSGSVLKTITRHIPSSSSTPSPFLPHSITPISAEMETTKIEKRSRISRTPGPLVRGFKAKVDS